MILTGLKVAKKVALDNEQKLSCLSPTKEPSAETPLKDNNSSDEKEEQAMKASEERLLSPEQSKHCIELIDERNMYDYVLELDALSKQQKARILNLTLLGVYSNLQMYFITSVSELITQAQMEDLIVLFYKF